MIAYRIQLDNLGQCPHFKILNLISSAKILPYDVRVKVSGIKAGAYLWSHYQPTPSILSSLSSMWNECFTCVPDKMTSNCLLLFNCYAVSDSLKAYGLHHARLLSPSPFPRACSNSCPSSQWCHPTISHIVAPFFSYHQSFPASESSGMSRLFASGGQSIEALASATILPKKIQCWFPSGLIGLISFLSKVKVKSLSHVRLFATLWTVVYGAPPSMGFSRQEYWSVLPFPFPGDLPHPGIEPWSPSVEADALPSEPPGKSRGLLIT